ncbi:MAG: hypothetical protein IIB42_02425 [Candidatus Marinimicrobia bacterium]|nr:hypothetical protein [Candidatus Neomarinimicrobiota bacterium]
MYRKSNTFFQPSIRLLLGLSLSMATLASLPLTAQVSGGASVYQKPFILEGKGARLGGYVDHEFKMDYNSDGELVAASFTPHRMIPFIFAEIVPGLRFFTEIEFEYGGDVEKSGEIKIEFATLDLSLSEAFNVRGGIILMPLGRFNLLHDSPVNDFTERPLIARYIVPTTFMESGAGVYGSVYPGEISMLSYELYLVNGFGDNVGLKGIRGGRPDLKSDNNLAKSVVGRLGFSPFLGLELGGSFYLGRWNAETDSLDSALGVRIFVLDGSYDLGPLQLQGEAARMSYDLSPGVSASGWGGYGQLNFHFGHGWVDRYPASVFTASLRLGELDIDQNALDNGKMDQRRVSLGLNFRPVEGTAFKFSYLWNIRRDRSASSYDLGDAFSQFRLSVATYF